MADLFADLHKKYDNFASAEALLFYSGPAHNWKALRLIVPDINKEFTDNVYIGRDPEGLFFYNSVDSIDNAVYYYTKRVVNPKDSKACASIKFFKDKSPNGAGTVIAEFLGYDYYENCKTSHMDGYGSTSTGNWRANTTNNHVDAVVRKSGGSYTVQLDASDSLGITASASGNEMTTTLKDASLDVAGTLFYKSRSTLSNGKYANYNNDRIVYYDNDYSGKEFNSFFFPFRKSDSVPKSLGIESGKSITLDTVTWS